jgi:hypothetical protein
MYFLVHLLRRKLSSKFLSYSEVLNLLKLTKAFSPMPLDFFCSSSCWYFFVKLECLTNIDMVPGCYSFPILDRFGHFSDHLSNTFTRIL